MTVVMIHCYAQHHVSSKPNVSACVFRVTFVAPPLSLKPHLLSCQFIYSPSPCFILYIRPLIAVRDNTFGVTVTCSLAIYDYHIISTFSLANATGKSKQIKHGNQNWYSLQNFSQSISIDMFPKIVSNKMQIVKTHIL